MLGSMLKAGSRTDYNKESTVLLQAGDPLQDRSVTVMVLLMNRRWNNKKRETKAKNIVSELAWAAVSGGWYGD